MATVHKDASVVEVYRTGTVHGAEREGVPLLLAHAPTPSWAFLLPDLVFFLRQSRLHVYREGA